MAFGNALCKLAESNDDIVGITAAMSAGTCMTGFARKFQARFYDVGIAEEHALVFAAGLAAAGKKPIVALYASFLQRALDNVMHDICLQNLPVIICTDRSGIVDDGPTHHGIHDLAFLLNLPNITIMAPADAEDMENMLSTAYKMNSPVVLRYPKGIANGVQYENKTTPVSLGKSIVLKDGKDVMLWAVGGEVRTAFETAVILKEKGINAGVVNVRFLKPFDSELLLSQAENKTICTIENSQINGGIGALVDSTLINTPHKKIIHFGWNDSIIPHGTVDGIRSKLNFTPQKIAEKIFLELS
jgi:1-deoxy-D-xylulose-5-phosphate synthase